MKSLASILAARQALATEYQRTEKPGTDCEAKIAKLLEDSALDDPKTASKLSELRSTAELAPMKLRQLEAKIAALDREQLRAAIIRATRQLAAVGRAELKELTSRVREAVE